LIPLTGCGISCFVSLAQENETGVLFSNSKDSGRHEGYFFVCKKGEVAPYEVAWMGRERNCDVKNLGMQVVYGTAWLHPKIKMIRPEE
jgi:hypothetical protein